MTARAAALTLARLRGVYYGWWIVAAWVVLNVYWAGTLFYGLTVFFNPVRQSFGWSATLMASIFSLASVLAGLLSPLTGAWFDRSGPRPQMLFACACGGAGLIALSRATSLLSFIAAFAVVSVGFSIWTGTGMATAGLWFARRRGLAMGVIVAGSSLGGILVPIWTSAVDAVGWRSAIVIAGIGMLVIGGPAAAILRHRPADLGLLPDGGQTPPRARDDLEPSSRSAYAKAPLADGDSGYWAALRTWQFWTISIVASIVLAGSTAATVLLLPRLLAAGIRTGLAIGIASSAILLGALGRPRLLADRCPIPMLAVAMFCLQAIGLFIFAAAPAGLLLPAFAVIYGLTNDNVRMLASLLLLRYFGPRAFGRILGTHLILLIPGRVLGPVIAGVFFDAGKGYELAFLLLSGATMASILPALLLRPPLSNASR